MSAGDVVDVQALDAYTPSLVMTPDQAVAHFRELKRIQREVLVRGTDYGKVPGAAKPSLYKSGAEKLQQFHGLASRFVRVLIVERWEDDPPFFRYDYGCQIYKVRTLPNGKTFEQPIAYREGTCNSLEDRYRWRWAFDEQVPSDLDKETLERRTREGKNGRDYTQYRIPNRDTATLANTIMQMAEKRAHTQAILVACAASGLFTDDNVEDLAEAGHLDPGKSAARGRSRQRAPRAQATERPAATIEQTPRIGFLQALSAQTKRLHLNHDQTVFLCSSLFGGKSASKDLDDGEIQQLTAILADVPTGTEDVARYVLHGGEVQ